MTTRGDALRKIRALQARALDASTPDEAAACARKAAQMMKDHKITGADIRSANGADHKDAQHAQNRPGPGSRRSHPANARGGASTRSAPLDPKSGSNGDRGAQFAPHGDQVAQEWMRELAQQFVAEFGKVLRRALR